MRRISDPRPARCAGDALPVSTALAARTLLWTLVLLGVWAAVPAALGWHVTTVVSGSMEPAIAVGDVVAAVPVDQREHTPGRVLLVDDPDHADRLRLHRLERVERDGSLRLRGDANPAADRTPVAPDAVLGVGVVRVPLIGLPGTWIRSGAWLSLAAGAAAVALLVMLSRVDRRILAGAPCARCGSPRGALGDTVGVHSDRWGSAAGVSAVAVALALVAATGASAAFSGSTVTAATMRSSAAFPCFSTVQGDPLFAWDFSEKGGSVAADSTGSGGTGTMSAGVERRTGTCADAPSVDLTATSGALGTVVSTRRTTGPAVFAAEAWFRTDRAQGRIIGFGSGASGTSGSYDRAVYVGASGKLVFGVHDDAWPRTVTSTARVADGEWHHVVGQYTAGRLELWLDGALVGSRADVTSSKPYAGYWRVGYDRISNDWSDYPPSNYFTGSVDGVRVFDRLLSPSEVAAHQRAGR